MFLSFAGANIPAMPGEVLHERGAEGVRRAKLWLDRTTRAEARWQMPDKNAVSKLSYKWADGADFSFDLGGLLRFGKHDQEIFVAECKFYSGHGAQGTMYVEYLAKCYRARLTNPALADQFLWVTWAAFSVKSWDKLMTPEYLQDAVIKHRVKCLGVEHEEDAKKALDFKLLNDVAERLHVIVLSTRQEENFVMSKEHLAIINKAETEKGD